MLRKVLSRPLIVLLAIIIQLTFIVTTLMFFSYAFWAVQIAIDIIALLLLIRYVDKKENPDLKVPWIFIIAIFPLFGVTIYFFFANHFSKKTENKYYLRAKELANKTQKQENNTNLYNSLNDKVGCFTYLSNVHFNKIYSNSKATYFESGEKFFASLIEDINNAKQFIFLEFFIIHQGKLWDRIYPLLLRKIQEGVEVRIIYDDVGSANLKHTYCKKLSKEGINCVVFNKISFLLTGIYNNRDHRKICIIDHSSAYTGGVNIGDEYINQKERFGYWKDVGVKIEGEAINSFITMFLSMYNFASKKEIDIVPYLNHDYQKFDDGFILPFDDGPRPLYQENIGENTFVNLINNAKKSIYISSPYFIPSSHLLSAIQNAAIRGVEVVIFFPKIPDKKLIYMIGKNYLKELIEHGVKIYLYEPGFNHAKMVLVDEELSFVGTINFDYRSLIHHFECGVLMYKTNCIKDIHNDFMEMKKVSSLTSEQTFKTNFLTRLVLSLFSVFTPLF